MYRPPGLRCVLEIKFNNAYVVFHTTLVCALRSVRIPHPGPRRAAQRDSSRKSIPGP